ncbi:LOW QUALITY PROTEIN: transcription factor 7 [Acinonyx jubatus]|uniref:LOW QUALITY PROTEIN: transcription factor 7 n=2 Tax=Felinae TaxID=338152 RepID=A0A6J2AR34_ACIJB|nr:LOW QUALITY PROTEIN: transcription factor 7 [Acinonyx jubatus]
MFGPASSRSRSGWRPRPAPAARPGGVSPRSARRASGSEVRTPGSPPAGPAPRPALPRAAPPRAERTMPQLDSGGGGAGGGDDLGAPDELLAFQDEGEEQDDKSRDSAAGPERDLAELKSSLVNESEGAAGGAGVPGAGAGARGEAEVGAEALGREHASQRLFPDKLPESLEDGLKAPECASGMYKDTVYSAFNLLMHYPPPSGAGQHPQPQPPLHNKASQPAHSVPQLSPLYEHFSSPHPTPAPADISQKQGVHRPLQTPDLSGFYSLTSGSMGQLPHTVSWFTHPSLMLGSGVPGHPAAIPHPAIVPPSGKQELQPYDRSLKTQAESKAEKEAKKPTIKKPLNAFMLYMKEMRAKVIAECTLKESAAINQILGRRWHALSREEQAKYYELARKERQLHMQLYPGWSARDNYGKKKRRSREKHQESNTDPGSPKKCRARFGLNQQTDWCGPCRRKKKCIRYLPGEGRCPSPVPSDDSALGCPGSPAPQDSPSYLLLPHFPTELLASPAERRLHHQVSRPLSASQPPGPNRPPTASCRVHSCNDRNLRDRQPSMYRTPGRLQGLIL